MNRRAHRERGTATLEMAVVTMLSVIILAMIVLAGRLTWHAIALTKGVANTSRIVATLPRATIVGGAGALKVYAQDTLNDATESAGIDLQPDEDSFFIMCGSFTCADAPFGSIRMGSRIFFRDTIFDSDFYYELPGVFMINADSTQTYANPYPAVSKN